MYSAGPLDHLIGQVLAARYRIGERLGAGAMGTVFRAEHVKVGRALAVKILHPRMVANEKHRRRFDREAEAAGKLHHPNVVGVVDAGVTPEGLRYLVMEYADGPTLGALIKRGALRPGRAVHIIKQLCDGLSHAHAHGLIHRDFKPDNVIVESDEFGTDRPRIVDFGIALAIADMLCASDRERLTTAGIVLGTPQYMAPEHTAGQPIDHRIDLFSLGVICYQLLLGKLPFEGSGADIARAYLTQPIPTFLERDPSSQVDPLLEAFARKLLAKSPDARLTSAKAARDVLDLVEMDRLGAATILGARPHDLYRVPNMLAAVRPVPWMDLPTEKMPRDSTIARLNAAAAAAAAQQEADALAASDDERDASDELAEGEVDDRKTQVMMEAQVFEGQVVSELAEEDSLRAVPPPEARTQAVIEAQVMSEDLAAVLGELASAEAAEHREAATRDASIIIVAEPPPSGEVPAAQPAVEITEKMSSLAYKPLRPRSAAALAAADPLPARARRNRRWVIAAVVGGAIVCAIAMLASDGTTPPVPAQLPLPMPAPAAPAAATPPPETPTPAAVTPPRPAVDPAAASRTVLAPPRRTPVLGQWPRLAEPAGLRELPLEPSTAELADFYSVVGRLLKHLTDEHGREVAEDLWLRFRAIRINDALGTRDKRMTAQAALRSLEREITARLSK